MVEGRVEREREKDREVRKKRGPKGEEKEGRGRSRGRKLGVREIEREEANQMEKESWRDKGRRMLNKNRSPFLLRLPPPSSLLLTNSRCSLSDTPVISGVSLVQSGVCEDCKKEKQSSRSLLSHFFILPFCCSF